ncbi:MAG: type II toxin-antitoxin system VapC family toxin [Chloroflexi bacterium]|nr:MAG: type II toxin-antitoxin system VapC family toxin [Chloroflexota bacterium]
MNALADTSVLAGSAAAEDLPEALAVSAVTLAELHAGVLLATTESERAARLATVVRVERDFEVLPVDASVAHAYGVLLATARAAGKRPRAMDLLIAATAAAHRVPLYTRDRDFLKLGGVEVRLIE